MRELGGPASRRAGRVPAGRRRARSLLVALAVVAGAPAARAQGDDAVHVPDVYIDDPGGEDEGEPLDDESLSVERVRLDERTPGSTLTDVLDEVAGLRMRRLGGVESPSSASIRGSTGAQVIVAQDGVALGSAAGLEVDLGELPAEFFEEVQVHRGASAAAFGAGGIGGVINLIPRRLDGGVLSRLEVGLGGFVPQRWDAGRFFSLSALRRVSLHTLAGLGRFSVLASGGWLGTEGDFDYLDDQGTRLETGDDRIEARDNNDASQWDVMLQGQADLRRGVRLRLLESASSRSRGVPGYGAVLANSTRSRTTKSLTSVELDQARGGGQFSRWRGRLSLRLRRDEWLDRLGEVGLSTDHDDDLTVDLGGELRAAWLTLPGRGTAWVSGGARYEEYFARRLLTGERWGWRRTTGSLATWVSWLIADGLVELAPQVRVDLIFDAPVGTGPPQPGEGAPEPATRAVGSEQLGVILRPLEWLTLRASGGATQRAPTFLELFGDRGTIVSNPALEPESGWAVDAGVRMQWRHLGALDSARLEVTGFYRHTDDLIQLVPSSQVTFVSINLGAARIAGAEASGHVAIEWTRATRSRWRGFLRLRSAVTFLDAVDVSGTYSDGNVLPLRPRWEVFGRLAFSWGPLEIAYELDAMARSYLDRANFREVPHRLFHSAEISADLGRWRGPRVTLLARNLANRISQDLPVQAEPQDLVVNRPVADVMGFPLPGLTIFLNLRWDLGAGH